MKIPVQCPNCQNRFEVDDSFRGLVAHCTQCLTQVSVPDAVTTEFSPAESALELKKDDIWPEMADQTPPPAPPRTPLTAPPSYQTNPIEAVGSKDITDSEPGFSKDLIRLALPFRSRGEAPTFACLLVMVVIIPFLLELSMVFCLALPSTAAILGILFTFFFNIVTETAQGADELPYLDSFISSLGHFWSEIVVPITNFLASILYVFLPATLFAVLTARIPGLVENFSFYYNLITLLLLLGGLFLWPMVFLFLAFDKITLLFRPDLVIRSIKAIILPYLLCWFCLLASATIIYAVYLLFPESSDKASFLNPRRLISVILLGTALAVFIYAMRVVGLLYRHYHHLFAWHIEKTNKHHLEE